MRTALAEAAEAEKQDPRQAARIYKYRVDITGFVEQGDPFPGSQLRRKAQELAQAAGARDQLLILKL